MQMNRETTNRVTGNGADDKTWIDESLKSTPLYTDSND